MVSSDGCYFCNSEVDIEEHHILPQRFDGSDLPGNTVDLCHDCHWKLERLYNKDFWEAIGVDDPRATKESHVTCNYHSCMKSAVGSYHASGVVGGSGLVYRCEEHMPDGVENGGEEGDDELELRSIGEEEEPSTHIARLEFGLENEPITPDSIEDMYDLVFDHLYFDESNGVVTEFQALVNSQIYHAEYSDGTWTVSYEGDY
ncbi:hypothetical protein HTG_16860 [Natrinema mahii]|nr:hypothetical protein HTG_16860 [Natrinema mahii]